MTVTLRTFSRADLGHIEGIEVMRRAVIGADVAHILSLELTVANGRRFCRPSTSHQRIALMHLFLCGNQLLHPLSQWHSTAEKSGDSQHGTNTSLGPASRSDEIREDITGLWNGAT